ncbi:MAG: hypothetical protein M3M87_04540 [Thermoproteota archaeon]|nr:hypothetical protein [Thermoproteota archaeon]
MGEGKQQPPPVIDWDKVLNKNVRSKEGEPIGNIVAHMKDSLQIETTGSRGQYIIPKEQVEGFDGAEVTLNLTIKELAKFALGGGP